jgi:hypothetical protein
MTHTTVVLPGGYVDGDGTLHRDAELAPICGCDEERLADGDVSRPAAFTTLLLACCVRRLGTISPVTPDLARRLLIADRLYLVLKLRQAMAGSHVHATVQCPWEECGEKVDIDFSLDDVPVRESTEKGPLYTLILSPEAAGEPAGDDLTREVTFRLPDGTDQESLSDAVESGQCDSLEPLLARCVRPRGQVDDSGQAVIDRLSPLARVEIERHMEAVAPAIDLALTVNCPDCSGEFSVPFDLQRFFFAECRVSRDRLYRDVHQLAYHYHWSEQEILSLPRSKRQHYLGLLATTLRGASRAV